MKSAYPLLLLAGSLLTGCHGDAPPPSPAVQLAPVELASTAPRRSVDDRLQVPQAALVDHIGTPGVFVMQDGLARFRMVKAGKENGDWIEISSGLSGDEELLIGRLDDVYDGSPVLVSTGQQRAGEQP